MRFLTDEQREALHRRAAGAFAAAYQRLRADVAVVLTREIVVPPVRAGYYHDYFCPEHSVQLEYHPDRSHDHRCPVDGKRWEGERYDRAWYWSLNTELSQAAYRLGLLWQIDRDRACFDKAVEILTQYAEQYPYYEPDLTRRNPGRCGYHTLDEAVWLLPLAWAFDCVREGLLSDTADWIARDLLRPAAEHLVTYKFRAIHNFACWHNAALGSAGILLDRPDLIADALHSESGFHAQMEQGVRADGLWWEGSLSYHYYTLGALLWHARAARNTDHDLRGAPQLKALFDAPLRLAYPDWSLPATNDCWYFIHLFDEVGHGIPSSAALHELAYAWYGDAAYAYLLRQTYAQRPRDTVEALLYGVEDLPDAPEPIFGPTHFPASGYFIWRSSPLPDHAEGTEGTEGTGGTEVSEIRNPKSEIRTYLLLKYGPHGGSHGHPDKLNLILFAHGERQSPDLGTPGYGIALTDTWYRTTLGHNTVLLDGKSQPEEVGNWETGKLGNWETGKLGNWETGKLGNWETSPSLLSLIS